MNRLVAVILWALLNGTTSNLYLNSPCGDQWIPFKDEECVKFVEKAGTQTKQDADVICHSYADGGDLEYVPKLINIKTKEKQEFLQRLLFEQHATFDNVWLGLDKGNDSVFRWNDGTELQFFTNWADQETIHTDGHDCVQMESGEGPYKTGQWVSSNCKRRNAVVCQRTQTWSITRLQNMLLGLKLQVERDRNETEAHITANRQETEKTIAVVKQEAEQRLSLVKQDTDQKINQLTRNPVPVGFTYVQLSDQSPPATIWPQVTWKDVSASYAGLFFRAVGGNAASFGQIQESASPRLAHVEWLQSGNGGGYTNRQHSVPSNGGWSDWVFSGDLEGKADMFLRFSLSTGEVRPRNQAVRIWKRTA